MILFFLELKEDQENPTHIVKASNPDSVSFYPSCFIIFVAIIQKRYPVDTFAILCVLVGKLHLHD